MVLSDSALSIIAIAGAAVAVFALLMTLAMGRRLRRIRRLVRPGPHRPQAASGDEAGSEWDALGVAYELAELRDAVSRSVQHVGVIRFDAFEDMGGQLSFAAALLDAQGDGLVLSSINGRSETRIYAKPIEHGSSKFNLSAEETEAVRRALGAVPH